VSQGSLFAKVSVAASLIGPFSKGSFHSETSSLSLRQALSSHTAHRALLTSLIDDRHTRPKPPIVPSYCGFPLPGKNETQRNIRQEFRTDGLCLYLVMVISACCQLFLKPNGQFCPPLGVKFDRVFFGQQFQMTA